MSMNVVALTLDLLLQVTGAKDVNHLKEIEQLDLHLRNQQGKLRRIENLHFVPHLVQLNLSYNAISEIRGLDSLVSLMELNLAENSLNKIEGLSSLKALRKLNLSGNLIERIPSSIKDLQLLSHFRIARNRLNVMDDLKHLEALSHLTNIRIDENPICSHPNFYSVLLNSLSNLKYLDGKLLSTNLYSFGFGGVSPNKSFSSHEESIHQNSDERVVLASSTFEELRKRIEKLTDKLLLNEEEKQSILERCQVLNQNTEKLKADLVQSDENLERAMVALRNANDELSRVQKQIIESKRAHDHDKALWLSERKRLTEENEALKEELTVFEKKQDKKIASKETTNVAELQKKISSLLLNLQEMKLNLQAIQEENRNLRMKCNELFSEKAANWKEIESAKGKMTSLQRNITDLSNQVKVLSRENSTLKSQLNDASDLVTVHGRDYNNVHPDANQILNFLDVKLSKLETAAAEILAHMILEGVEECLSATPSQKSELRNSCIHIAFRIIIAITAIAREEKSDNLSDNDTVFEYFAKAGDKRIISRFVENAIVGVKTLEDSVIFSREIEQLQKIRADLDAKIDSRHDQVKEKEKEIKQLQQHILDCRRQAESTLSELESLSVKLQSGRDELLKLDSEVHLMKRELEITRNNLKESCALNEIENKSIDAARERFASLKHELSDMEGLNLELKDQILKEESKLRATKAAIYEKTREFKIQVVQFNKEVKTKKEILDQIEKQRRTMEEETLHRRKELEGQISLLIRQQEEEILRLSNLRNDFQSVSVELEQGTRSKRYLEQEVVLLTEKVENIKIHFQSSEEDFKRKTEYAERQLTENNTKIKESREKLLELQRETASLQQKTMEQRRISQDLLVSHESTRKHLDSEILEIQNRSQHASLALRQTQEQCCAKQIELQNLQSEVRSIERRFDEAKKLVRDEEINLEHLKNEMKFHEDRRTSLIREIQGLKTSIEETKILLQVEKQSFLETSKILESTNKTVERLKDEESDLKNRISRAKEMQSNSSKAHHTSLQEIQNIHHQIEEEKRNLLELKNNRSSLQNEYNVLSQQFEKSKEMLLSKSIQRQELDSLLGKGKDELANLQKQILHSQSVVQELKSRESELKMMESTIKMSCERLSSEIDLLRQSKEYEESLLTRLRQESRELTLNLENLKYRHESLSQQNHALQIELTAIVTQQQNLESLKRSNEIEIQKIIERRESEIRKHENVEKLSREIENRLMDLKDEVLKMEDSYESKRALSVEESRKLEAKKALLHRTTTELTELENEVQKSTFALEQRKQKEMLEIGLLTNLKESQQTQYLKLVAAAEKIAPAFPTQIVESDFNSTRVSPRKNELLDNFKIQVQQNKNNDEQNTSFSSTIDGNGDEMERLAFSSLQKAVDDLRSQSVAALQSNPTMINR